MKQDNSVDVIIKGFINYLEENKALNLLPEISDRITKLSWTKVDPNLAIVTSAIKLNTLQLTQIQTHLSQIYQRKVRVKNRLNRSIIGGLHIYIDGKTIDSTLKTRLKELKDQITYG